VTTAPLSATAGVTADNSSTIAVKLMPIARLIRL
jgi:hypothetical protein